MILDSILSKAADAKASDIHLAVGSVVMNRINGLLVPGGTEVLSADLLNKIAEEMMSEEQKNNFKFQLELNSAYEIKGIGRFRLNWHKEKGQLGLVARLIPAVIPTMAELNMPSAVFSLIKKKQGLILVTGATGQGKSTAMASMVNAINSEESAHIVTLEDPIEYVSTNKKSIIKQRELGRDMKSFDEALKHVLRQDPNVVMIGEMRDLETISTAITVAETGHLVLATLHTFSAGQTIERMVDVFPPHQQEQIRIQLSGVLKGVICQRLFPKIGGGRVAGREVLLNTPAVANLIRDNKINQIRTVLETNVAEGMCTMQMSVQKLVTDGLVTKEDAEIYLS